jgi:2-C-methyl-D-erythritol 4-phosphate cytidylyltransferase
VSTWAVLVAAGRGERLGGDRPKAFTGLGERVLLAESLERLEASEWIDAIVVVVPEEWEEPAILLAEELNAGKVNSAVAGGATRADSVRAGVAEIPDDALIALVHDAARPILPEEVIGRVLGGLGEDWDGVVAGLPLADTVKRVDQHGRVAETVDRTGLYAHARWRCERLCRARGGGRRQGACRRGGPAPREDHDRIGSRLRRDSARE